jgi:hypothetical protein
MIVDALEEAEETGFFFVKLVVSLIDYRCDATNASVTLAGQEELHSGVIVEGILGGIEIFLLLAD